MRGCETNFTATFKYTADGRPEMIYRDINGDAKLDSLQAEIVTVSWDGDVEGCMEALRGMIPDQELRRVTRDKGEMVINNMFATNTVSVSGSLPVPTRAGVLKTGDIITLQFTNTETVPPEWQTKATQPADLSLPIQGRVMAISAHHVYLNASGAIELVPEWIEAVVVPMPGAKGLSSDEKMNRAIIPLFPKIPIYTVSFNGIKIAPTGLIADMFDDLVLIAGSYDLAALQKTIEALQKIPGDPLDVIRAKKMEALLTRHRATLVTITGSTDAAALEAKLELLIRLAKETDKPIEQVINEKAAKVRQK